MNDPLYNMADGLQRKKCTQNRDFSTQPDDYVEDYSGKFYNYICSGTHT